MSRAAARQTTTRIQRQKTDAILAAALDVFSTHGFRGATLDQIAEAAGLSKPNLLYYFASKEDVHRMLLERLLDTWLDPLRRLDPAGDPATEIAAYIRRKLEMARDYPRESRLFAGEILQGAPHIADVLRGPLKDLVDAKAARHRRLGRRGPHRPGRPAPPDRLDLGRHPALRRLRRPARRRARPRPRRPLRDAEPSSPASTSARLAPWPPGLTFAAIRRSHAQAIRTILGKVSGVLMGNAAMVASIASRGVAAGRAALRSELGRPLRGASRRAPRRSPDEPAARSPVRPAAPRRSSRDRRPAGDDAPLPAPARAAAAARAFAAGNGYLPGLIVDRLA